MRFLHYGYSKHHFWRRKRILDLEARGIRIEERGDWRRRWVCESCGKTSAWLWNGVFGSADRHLASRRHQARLQAAPRREPARCA